MMTSSFTRMSRTQWGLVVIAILAVLAVSVTISAGKWPGEAEVHPVRLTPVAGDPFAVAPTKAPNFDPATARLVTTKAPTLIPIAYDPFAKDWKVRKFIAEAPPLETVALPKLTPIEVEGPGGVIVEFPHGTPVSVMERAMRKKFGKSLPRRATSEIPVEALP